LISPTVVVTAAHCTGAEYAVDRVDVTFAAVATDAAGELTSPSIPGAAHFDPRYLAPVKNGGTKAFVAQAAFDRGVVVLSRPAAEVFPGITPALLPILGVLDAYATAANAKNTQGLVSVGYGVTREPHTNPNQILYDGVRQLATGPLAALDPEVLWTRGNPNSSWGNGGACFGDSGGPNFLGTTVVSVFSFVKSPCQNLDGSTRLDTNAARDFLSQYPVAFPN